MSAATRRLVVLVSGSGTNLQAILDACAAGRLPAQVAAVVSNKQDAYALQRAKESGVPAVYLPKTKSEDRQAYDSKLAELVKSYHPDWIVLAGWMRILTTSFLGAFPNRVINLHPALPGAFPGTMAIERAYQAFQSGEITQTGVMVHLVPDEGVDNGPVLAERVVSIHRGETLEELETRMHLVEHELLVSALSNLVGDQTVP